MKAKTLISQIIRFLFILLWIYAAASKLIDYQKFVVQLGKSPMLTQSASILSRIVPAAEILFACMLFSEKYRRTGLYASFSLMVIFTTYIFIITRLTDNVPCSCGGILETLTWNDHLVFNALFVILALTAILLDSTQESHVRT